MKKKNRKRPASSAADILTIVLCLGGAFLSVRSVRSAGASDGIPIVPLACALVSGFLLGKAMGRRRQSDRGIRNTAALAAGLLSFVCTAMLSLEVLVQGEEPVTPAGRWLLRFPKTGLPGFRETGPSDLPEDGLQELGNQVRDRLGALAQEGRRLIFPRPGRVNWIFLAGLAAFVLLAGPWLWRLHLRRKVRMLADRAEEMTPEEFLLMTRQKPGGARTGGDPDFPGVYILRNRTRNKYYVGQGQRTLGRVKQHFTGHGNGDVYADWKYGDDFTIRLLRLEGSGFRSLNSLERNAIAAYKAFSKGYNKTRGNRG